MSDLWNRCDECGRLISMADFASEAAIRFLETPDSEFSREEYTTLCKVHRAIIQHIRNEG